MISAETFLQRFLAALSRSSNPGLGSALNTLEHVTMRDLLAFFQTLEFGRAAISTQYAPFWWNRAATLLTLIEAIGLDVFARAWIPNESPMRVGF